MGIVYFYFYSIHFYDFFFKSNGLTLFYSEDGKFNVAGNGSFAHVVRKDKHWMNYFGETVNVKVYSLETDSTVLIGDIEPRYFTREVCLGMKVVSYRCPVYDHLLCSIGHLDKSMHYDVWAGCLTKDMRETFEWLSISLGRKLEPSIMSRLWPKRYQKTSPFTEKFSLNCLLIRLRRVRNLTCEITRALSKREKIQANLDMYDREVSSEGEVTWVRKEVLNRGRYSYVYNKKDKCYHKTILNEMDLVEEVHSFYDDIHPKRFKFQVFRLNLKNAYFHSSDKVLAYLFDDVLEFLINTFIHEVFNGVPTLKVLAALARLGIGWKNSVTGYTYFQY